MFRLSFFFLILFTITSCAQFHTGRSYLSEMEHDDSRMFNPEEDFPVVAGDTGEMGMSSSERRNRTPASEEDVALSRSRKSLRNELRDLEGNLSEEQVEDYEKVSRNLSISEKIYLLKLSPGDRKEYLISRGLYSETRSPASKNKSTLFGMNKNEVFETFGKPDRVEVAGNPSQENERWLYHSNGASKYIYFESGRVHSWE